MSLLAQVAPIQTPSIDWLAIGPELALVGAAVAIVLQRSIMRRRGPVSEVSLFIAIAGMVAAAALLVRQWTLVQDDGPITTISSAG